MITRTTRLLGLLHYLAPLPRPGSASLAARSQRERAGAVAGPETQRTVRSSGALAAKRERPAPEGRRSSANAQPDGFARSDRGGAR